MECIKEDKEEMMLEMEKWIKKIYGMEKNRDEIGRNDNRNER